MEKQEHKKVIGFDMDGVILDHTDHKLNLLRERGFDLKKEETPSGILRGRIPRDILREIQHALYNDPLRVSKAALVPGAREGLRVVRDSRIPYFLVSRRRTPDIAKEILSAHGIWPEFFNDANTFFVEEIEHKDDIAKALGVTVYIDDETRVLDKLVSVENRVLFDPLDVFPDSTAWKRLCSWEDILRHIL